MNVLCVLKCPLSVNFYIFIIFNKCRAHCLTYYSFPRNHLNSNTYLLLNLYASTNKYHIKILYVVALQILPWYWKENNACDIYNNACDIMQTRKKDGISFFLCYIVLKPYMKELLDKSDYLYFVLYIKKSIISRSKKIGPHSTSYIPLHLSIYYKQFHGDKSLNFYHLSKSDECTRKIRQAK